MGRNANPGSKKCRICRKVLPLSRFGPLKKSADGHEYRCNACNSLRQKKTRMKNARRWAGADPYSEHPTGKKRCSACKRTKPVTSFSRNVQAGDGLQSACKRCQMDGWHRSQYGRTLREGNPSCDICGNRGALAVDHDHKTGVTRGNLCRACNTALGALNDDVSLFRNAIKYLERWRKQAPNRTRPKRAS